ncbi:hypothetical protein D0867_08907 [Hortaea werneckii]|uniref:Xylanolytic transcriptional activator regulatory domain-containing protein n=1 Tax=Hortaea werneckii TaxID=91943 RepID=A0A3M6Z0N4_HORWE|nr:hypothetical protein D0867_08907 [Hortaea werneckii]
MERPSAEKLFGHPETKEGITLVAANPTSATDLQIVVDRVAQRDLPAFQHVYAATPGDTTTTRSNLPTAVTFGAWDPTSPIHSLEAADFHRIMMTGVFSNFGIVSASSAYKATSLHLLSQGHNESTWTMITGAAGDYGAGRVTAFTQGALYSMANVASRELAGINIRFNEMYLYLRVDFDGPGTVCPLEFAGKHATAAAGTSQGYISVDGHQNPYELRRLSSTQCDSFRPCSLCLRANAACVSTPRPSVHKPRARNSPDGTRSPASGQSENIQESDNAVQSSRKRKRRDANATVQSVIESSDDSVRNPEGSARDVPEATPIDLDIGGEPTRCASEAGERSASAAPIEDERQSTTSFLANELPSESVMVSLLEEYFNSVHWFSLVIYEPRFRLAFNAIRKERAHPSQRIFLLLLSVVLGLGAWYRGQRSYTVGQPTSEQSKSWSAKLIANAESQIIELLDHSSVTAVQTLTLLGSFYVYHGRPNLSFSLLGAVVKLAHANGLHREPQSVSDAEKEERKRVWWTIYTWDKFSSVTYGRPVSIHDDDCNVSMPEDVEESIDFKNESLSDSKICFSAYQRELNKLYLLASPAINQIYSATERTARKAHGYVSLVEEVTSQLWQWRQSLPEHLLLCTLEDCPTLLDLKRKAHYLQSLSLYLTFDSLLIILHRPFLGPQLEVLQYHGLGGNHGLGVSGLRDPHPRDPSLPRRTSSFEEDAVLSGYKSQEQWRRAANRTASTIELPQLTELACDGHLVAFLALNLFNAAIATRSTRSALQLIEEKYRGIARLNHAFVASRDRSHAAQHHAGFQHQDYLPQRNSVSRSICVRPRDVGDGAS